VSLAAAPIPAVVELTVTPTSEIGVAQTVEVTITVPNEANYAPTGAASLYKRLNAGEGSIPDQRSAHGPNEFCRGWKVHADGKV
jgi:hypothetical protein